MFEQIEYDHRKRELTQTLHIWITKFNGLCRINTIVIVECWNNLIALDIQQVPDLFHVIEAGYLDRDLVALPQFIQLNYSQNNLRDLLCTWILIYHLFLFLIRW
jgi:hypothetical protein